MGAGKAAAPRRGNLSSIPGVRNGAEAAQIVSALFLEDREIQLTEMLRIDDNFGFHNLFVLKLKAQYPEETSTRSQNDSHGSVHQGWLRLGKSNLSRERNRSLGPGPRTANFSHALGALGSDRNIRVEHGKKPFEIAFTQCSNKCIDNSSLAGQLRRGDRGALYATTRAAGELPSRGFGTSHY